MADRAARAAEEIAWQIGEIQGETDQAAAAVEQQGSATRDIVRTLVQAAAGTSEGTTNIAGVAEASEKIGAVASRGLVSAADLSRQSEPLSSEVRHFLATVRAVRARPASECCPTKGIPVRRRKCGKIESLEQRPIAT